MDWKRHEEDVIDIRNVKNDTAKKEIKKSENDVSLSTLMKLDADDAREFICGWGSAVINIGVTFPINKIIFRQILEGTTAITAGRQLYNEGIRLLYRGIFPPLCQKTLSLSLMFSVYEGSRRRIYILTEHEVMSMALGATVAGTTEAVLMPLERVQTLLQDWRYHHKFKNTLHAFNYLLRNYGFTECYRGLVPIVFRNSLSNLTFFTLREESKVILGDNNSFFANFVKGALIGGFTSTLFYPINIVKVHMQSKIGGDFQSFRKCVQEIYVLRNRSIMSFYKGVQLNCMRSFISWGVINSAYDSLKEIVL